MKTHDYELWLERLWKGERRAAARLISQVENNRGRIEIMCQILPRTGQRMILGITGPPGAGKSSLVGAMTHLYRDQKEKVGIVAVDPSSPYSGGAILGDRIRMQSHSTDPGVFIRSMGTRGHLGGVARSTGDVLRILEAAGYERLLLETVGVGQSELEIMELADTVIVVLNPGTGDGIQAIKAGIMEIADIFVVNKADLPGAEHLKNDIEMVLGLNGEKPWRPPVILTSVLDQRGLSELRDQIALHQNYLIQSGKNLLRRKQAFAQEVWYHWEELARQSFAIAWENLRDAEKDLEQENPYRLAEKVWASIVTEETVKHVSFSK
ncbi:LAO/AO transport system ATPase [Desulfitobacterium dehalogenans ATCC 51507]|uniref:LAO/AO transport system ATPase n=1 Tax=Desulfitobacterium dehalogenans (strain ATCC 51507 / DSM 9161 / JW/IU-DC1) TaxID=756499 RepID=I4AD47_DESDJ|nr:methylmalonyl Co-A mutase-associated GTPase MeaB [Desulfitobacterium dehalogenans]AFM01882.1 LAO/AO transport system ATPase [Desulfitobacterium dehalogenans ATCC 51507]